MLEALRVSLSTLNDVRLKGFSYIWVNLAFVLFSLPLITMPAAFAALMLSVHRIQHDPLGVSFEDFFGYFKKHFWWSLLWGLAYALFFTVNTINLLSFTQGSSPLSVLRVFWLGAGFTALMLLLLTWPFYVEMSTPTLLGATRNTLVMMLHHPAFTFVLLCVILVIIACCMVLKPLFFLLGFSTLAALANAAVHDCVKARVWQV